METANLYYKGGGSIKKILPEENRSEYVSPNFFFAKKYFRLTASRGRSSMTARERLKISKKRNCNFLEFKKLFFVGISKLG
jgi:hypothetical protein